MEFKRQLAEKKPILTVDEEKIVLKKNNYGERKLVIQLTLNDYSLNKSKYNELLEKEI